MRRIYSSEEEKQEQLKKWREASSKWREKNREYERERSRQYYRDNHQKCLDIASRHREKNPEYYREKIHGQTHENRMLTGAKCRAKKKGLDFDLTLSDIIVPEYCPILGIPLVTSKGQPTSNSPCLDRVDNSKGYTKDNVRVISHYANMRKADLTITQLENMIAYMKGEL